MIGDSKIVFSGVDNILAGDDGCGGHSHFLMLGQSTEFCRFIGLLQ
jgi:hypothetical protein